jgi:hypothetical protein
MTAEVLYAGEPNRLLASGTKTLDAVALTFQVRSDGVRIEARTGSVSERTVDLEYGEIVTAELVEEVSTGIRLETADAEYTVTNVTSSVREGRAVVEEIRSRTTTIGGFDGPDATTDAARDDRPADASAPGTADGERVATDGSPTGRSAGGRAGADAPTADESDATIAFGGYSRVGPGETIDCPRCDHETLVPDEIPGQEQNVVCPGCEEVIGETHESGEYVRIDLDP